MSPPLLPLLPVTSPLSVRPPLPALEPVDSPPLVTAVVEPVLAGPVLVALTPELLAPPPSPQASRSRAQGRTR